MAVCSVTVVVASVLAFAVVLTNGLKCYMCGQYNEGVGSITPCLNYSEKYAHLYLKECSRPSERYCVKYVSELSTVRDCATECTEKEVWETQTYCCTEDGCNGANNISTPNSIMLFLFLIFAILNVIRH
ncbi:U-scoloptoxin(05)-Sm1a [Hermetia illucens]|uniref:U-scoloptoxin(05)-Sm1a n=1 Tax=Hermetia illucens TaxID=343691 RepID=UPI0018CC2E10|nr:U-scoloptoxin(05)-Sm1a [Hermetia illucens]